MLRHTHGVQRSTSCIGLYLPHCLRQGLVSVVPRCIHQDRCIQELRRRLPCCLSFPHIMLGPWMHAALSGFMRFWEFKCRLSRLHGKCFTHWVLIPAPDLLPFSISLQSNVTLDYRWACVKVGDQERDSGNWAGIKRVGLGRQRKRYHRLLEGVRERERAGSSLS